MDLDLAGTRGCPHCDFEGYDDDFKNGRCPRCRKSIDDAPSDSGHGGGGGGGPQRRRTKLGAAKAGGRRKKKVGRPSAEPEAPKEKRQVILTEAFKTQVFEALKAGQPNRAQELCIGLAAGNEDHAKQVYGYLLGIARKKGWLGIHKGGAAAVEPAAPPQPAW